MDYFDIGGIDSGADLIVINSVQMIAGIDAVAMLM